MSTWVVLKPPPDKSYYRVIRAASDKHFDMIDNGYEEVSSGNWFDMLELDRELEEKDNQEWIERMREAGDLIELFDRTKSCLIYVNETILNGYCQVDANYLDDKTFL